MLVVDVYQECIAVGSNEFQLSPVHSGVILIVINLTELEQCDSRGNLCQNWDRPPQSSAPGWPLRLS